jgi:hypothetical protein
MATNSTVPPSNAFTPLAFLPADIAFAIQFTAFMSCGTFGVSIFSLSPWMAERIPPRKAFLWDWIMSASDEMRMVRARKFNIPVFVYFVSR